MALIKIKRRTPMNMTRQISMKTIHESHTPPLGYASLLHCLSKGDRRVEDVLVSPHDPGTWHEGSF